jgi:hypothetical protein
MALRRHNLLSAHRFWGLLRHRSLAGGAIGVQKGGILRVLPAPLSALSRIALRSTPTEPGRSVMAQDDNLHPRLGRIGNKGKGAGKRLGRVLAAANLARGGAGGKAGRGSFFGSRIGRGSGVGLVLGSRGNMVPVTAAVLSSKRASCACPARVPRRPLRICVIFNEMAPPEMASAGRFMVAMKTLSMPRLFRNAVRAIAISSASSSPGRW